MTDDTKPDYWNPCHFREGERIFWGNFPGFVLRHWCRGDWEVRAGGEQRIVSGAELRRLGGAA